VSERPLLIVGAGAHGRVVLDLARSLGLEIAGFLDDIQPIDSLVDGRVILGTTARLREAGFVDAFSCIVAIGNNLARRRFSNQIRSHGREPAVLTHPSSIISGSARIGSGTVMIGGNMVFSGAVIGEDVLVDPDATIGADSRVGAGAYVCPGCHLGAGVSLGEECFLGIGAVVIPGRKIGRRAIVGAGSVVISDIPDGKLAVGNPASVKGDAVLDDWSPYPARAR